MIAAIKAEVRKLLTVRSTYFLVGIAVLFTIFFTFYIEGFHLTGKDLLNTHLYNDDIVGALTSLPMIFAAIIAVLLMTHEYRYNTIMHTLTASNSRSKVLAAKIIVISVFALVFTAVIAVLGPLMSSLGVHLHGATLAPQELHYHSIVWRALYNGWAYILMALLLAVLIRNQIGAIVSIFAIPTIEQILSLLLKHHSVYLPFISLNAVLQHPEPRLGVISYGRAAIVFGIYLLVGWIIAWVLFIRRDAN